jgi:hypothetical protein
MAMLVLMVVVSVAGGWGWLGPQAGQVRVYTLVLLSPLLGV